MQRLFHGGTGSETIAAATSDGNFVVLGVYACFHIVQPGSEPRKRGIIHKKTQSGKPVLQNNGLLSVKSPF
jgi:hypothetical protein